MNKQQSSNLHLRTLYAPGFSFMTMSYYRTNYVHLILKLVPYIGVDKRGLSQYSKNHYISTSLAPDGAELLLTPVRSILNGTAPEKPIEVQIACKSGKSLTFEYKPDPDRDNQISAFMVAKEGNLSIPFRFPIHQHDVWEDGKMVTKVVLSGLGAFALTLDGYIRDSGAGNLSKLSDEELEKLQIPLIMGLGVKSI